MVSRLSFLSRALSKLFCEVLPATAASAICALLLSTIVHPTNTPSPSVVADTASTEQLQMARDEHARIVVYLEKSGEARLLADIAAEKEKLRAAAEQAAVLAEQKARAVKTKASGQATTQTATLTAKPAKTVPARHQSPKPETVSVVQPPLQLDVASAAALASTAAPAAKLAARGDENLLATKWRETTATVERIPGWVRSVVERLSDKIPPLSSPQGRQHRLI